MARLSLHVRVNVQVCIHFGNPIVMYVNCDQLEASPPQEQQGQTVDVGG